MTNRKIIEKMVIFCKNSEKLLNEEMQTSYNTTKLHWYKGATTALHTMQALCFDWLDVIEGVNKNEKNS